MTFAEEMVAKLEEVIRSNAGVSQVTIDGRTVAFANLIQQYDYWRGQVSRQSGQRPLSAQIDLSGF